MIPVPLTTICINTATKYSDFEHLYLSNYSSLDFSFVLERERCMPIQNSLPASG